MTPRKLFVYRTLGPVGLVENWILVYQLIEIQLLNAESAHIIISS